MKQICDLATKQVANFLRLLRVLRATLLQKQLQFAPPESQRDSIIQPRVGAQRLPWVNRPKNSTLKGLHQFRANGFNPFRVVVISFRHPA
jgi:hypothetical protein